MRYYVNILYKSIQKGAFMIKSFIVVGLNKMKTLNFCQKLANSLGMHFLDVEALFEYSIVDSKEALSRCGKAYLDREEKKTVLSSLEFEDTVIFMTFDILAHHLEEAKRLDIFYYYKEPSDCEDPLLEFVFEERDSFLKENSRLVLTGAEQNKIKAVKDFFKGARK